MLSSILRDLRKITPHAPAFDATKKLSFSLLKDKLTHRNIPSPSPTSSTLQILLKFPSRNRPTQCLDVLKKYISFASKPNLLCIQVTLDDDDASATPEFIQSLKNLHPLLSVSKSPHTSKVDAMNADITQSFDILVLGADDIYPVSGYDDIIRDRMEQLYPDMDGVLFFNDGYCGSHLNTIPILGSKYYARFGYIYNPEYKSFFCDNEFQQVSEDLKKSTYFNTCILKHEHPCNNSSVKSDATYAVNDIWYAHDQAIWNARKKKIDVSILICCLPDRDEQLRTLISDIENFDTPLHIEILTDFRTLSTGTKRNALLKRAVGTYCCFVDDDDKLTPQYFTPIEEALKGDYDCVQLNGRMYVNNHFHRLFFHSLKYSIWSGDSGGYYRNPNHLNPIKREIAIQVQFPDVVFAEDKYFSKHILPLLKTEYTHTSVQYLYLYSKK